MRHKEIQELKTLWQHCVLNRGLFTEIFYNKLFEVDPSSRRLFKTDIMTQGMKLIDTIRFIINALGSQQNVKSEIIDLGKRHKEYRVQKYQYYIVLDCFLYTFEMILKDKFSEDQRINWIKFYNIVQNLMIELPD